MGYIRCLYEQDSIRGNLSTALIAFGMAGLGRVIGSKELEHRSTLKYRQALSLINAALNDDVKLCKMRRLRQSWFLACTRSVP